MYHQKYILLQISSKNSPKTHYQHLTRIKEIVITKKAQKILKWLDVMIDFLVTILKAVLGKVRYWYL